MKSCGGKYSLIIEGAELEAKTVQKLKDGENLILKRIDDERDTCEILVCTSAGKEIDLLSYGQSLALAPFLDDGTVEVKSVTVIRVTVKPGKTRAKDKTILTFRCNFQYDDSRIQPFADEKGAVYFVPVDNFPFTAAVRSALNGCDDFVAKIRSDCYDVYIPLDADAAKMYDIELDENQDYLLCGRVSSKDDFSHCTVKAYICVLEENESQEPEEIEINREEKAFFVTLVNHRRVFDDEQPFLCEIL